MMFPPSGNPGESETVMGIPVSSPVKEENNARVVPREIELLCQEFLCSVCVVKTRWCRVWMVQPAEQSKKNRSNAPYYSVFYPTSLS
jgi:hypothetical protein